MESLIFFIFIYEDGLYTQHAKCGRAKILYTLDEDAHVLIYVEEALRGHTLLNVYVPELERAEQVKEILAAHHARLIKHFGRWAITVLHP